MQVPPSTSLLHALSRLPDSPATSGAAAPSRSEAARAAAKAAFQNLKTPAPIAPHAAAAVPATQPAPNAQPGKILPRGSVVNIVV
jgi:hypothetical protein